MTIIELIEKLAEYPPDMRVVCHDGEYADFWDIHDIYIKDGGSLMADGLPIVTEPVVNISPFDDGLNR